MCEEESHKRPNLLEVQQRCEQHQKNALLPPPDRTIKQLAQEVLQHPVSLLKYRDQALFCSSMVREMTVELYIIEIFGGVIF